MSHALSPALLLCTALMGCGGTLVIDDSTARGLSPTATRADVAAFDAQIQDLRSAPRTSVAALPTGTVTYDGQLGSNIRLDGQDGYGMLGDLRMRVAFGSGAVDGSVTDINLLENGTPIQRFGGQLNIDGSEFAGRLEADADGILSLVAEDGTRTRTNMALDLSGDVINDVFVGDAIVGSVTGFGDGYQLTGETFNVLLDNGGSFVGTVD